LAQLPTPIERLERWPRAASGVQLFIKRDDLTGSDSGGNKLRKLEFALAEAQAAHINVILTCGGAQSNHCRATAIAAARLGMRCVLLLRTPDGEPADPRGNLQVAKLVGAEIVWTDPHGYRERQQLLHQLAREETSAGNRPYVIPEGASNAIGALGYARAWQEIQLQARDRQLSFDAVIHPCGSGGTTAGLAIGMQLFGGHTRLIGVAVCDSRHYFQQRINEIVAEARERFDLVMPDARATIELLDQYTGGGYGVAPTEALRTAALLAKQSGVLLDPVYGAKAFHGFCKEIDAGKFPAGARVLYVHTGGVLGWTAAADPSRLFAEIEGHA
jgi:D-cysteine desulfhydrase